MTFFKNFLLKTRKCWNHYQIVTTLTIKKTCTKKTPSDTITLDGLQVKITTEVNQACQAYILTCVK